MLPIRCMLFEKPKLERESFVFVIVIILSLSTISGVFFMFCIFSPLLSLEDISFGLPRERARKKKEEEEKQKEREREKVLISLAPFSLFLMFMALS